MADRAGTYEVEPLETGQRVLLRLIAAPDPWDERERERFLAATRVAGQVGSEHAVQVVVAGIHEDVPWLVTEIVDGQTLDRRLEEGYGFERDAALDLLQQIGGALHLAHQAGFVHGELRPEDIVLLRKLRPGGRPAVKIDGFGVSSVVAEWTGRGAGAVGNPDRWLWTAPERAGAAEDAPLQPRADIWTLGLLAFQVLTGVSFWRETGGAALLREVRMERLRDAVERADEERVGEKLPRGFDPWFRRCVTRAVEERFPDIPQALRELEVALTAPAVPRPPVPFPHTPPLIMANPKGSLYDSGLRAAMEEQAEEPEDHEEPEKGGPGGPYREPGRGPHRTPLPVEPRYMTANPKSSMYDRGLSSEARVRWGRVIPLLLVLGVAVYILLRLLVPGR